MVAIAAYATCIHANEIKLGWVNADYVLTESREAADIADSFEVRRTAMVEEIRGIDQRIKALEANLEIDRLVKTPAALQADRARIDSLKVEAGQKLEFYFGEGGAAERLYTSMMEPLSLKIVEAIEAVSNQQGYAMVFDVSTGTVLFARDEDDLSQMVIDKLNLDYLSSLEEPSDTEMIDE